MKTEEIIIKIIGKLNLLYDDKINQQEIRLILEEVLYNYNIKPKEFALVPRNNMQDMMMLFLTSKKIEGASDVTIKNYGLNLSKLAYDIQKNVENITTMDIRIHLANYAKTGVKNSTIATRTDILRSFFSWLKTEEYITRNPLERIKNIKVEETTREPLTQEEFEILSNGAKTLRQKALLHTFYATGCRLNEVVCMNISDINWDKMQLTVLGKGNKERIVYLNARAKIFIQKYLKSRDDDCEALFVTQRKPIKRLGNRAIQREIKQIKEQSGLKRNVYPHLLRHTYSSTLLSRGASISSISKMLGHKNLEVTSRYAKTTDYNIEYEYRKYMVG
ncbi:MAG TPA: tyrosine-type recombinase/integrase [Mollicutes bacterium]|nr:tyrosine-type recombinase/integrase [Mollicutes bacterium]